MTPPTALGNRPLTQESVIGGLRKCIALTMESAEGTVRELVMTEERAAWSREGTEVFTCWTFS